MWFINGSFKFFFLNLDITLDKKKLKKKIKIG